jgi:hypothetical protein
MGREIAEPNGSYELRESMTAYEAVFDPENDGSRQKNSFFWYKSN